MFIMRNESLAMRLCAKTFQGADFAVNFLSNNVYRTEDLSGAIGMGTIGTFLLETNSEGSAARLHPRCHGIVQ